jgi:molybdopterin synthase sulfur carrier subunit
LIILYFAWVRQKLGMSEERIELPSGVTTVGALAESLRARGGAYADVFSDLRRLRAAVNQEHSGWDAPISAKDEIAFFPPVTGG